jgi:hypothetical protein
VSAALVSITRRQRDDWWPFVAVVTANVAVLAGVFAGFTLPMAGVVVLLPAVALVVRRPQLGVLALIALVPYHGLLTIVPHPTIVQAWKEALTVLTLGATFVAPAARAKGRRPLPSWTIAVAGLLAIALCSAVYVGGLTGIYGLKIYFFYVLVAIAVWRCPLNAIERDRLVTILMVNGVITAVYGIAQQVLGGARLNQLGYPYNTTIRFTGSFLRSFSTFDQPFSFGFFLMVVLLVCIPVVLQDPLRRRNQLFLLLMPIVGIGLLTSIVRGAWLGFAVGLAYLGIHRYRVLLLAIPLGLTALLFLPPDFAQSALSGTSSQQRATGWAENIHVITSHPLGAGIGTTGAIAEKVQLLTNKTVDYYQPDNYYFLVAYELGMLGLWWHFLLLGSAFGSARAASTKLKGPDSAFAAGTAAVVVAAVAASVMATLFQIPPFDVLWWVLLAVVATTVVTDDESTSAHTDSALAAPALA